MNIQDKIKAIKFWQETPQFRPLTCGKDSAHGNLIPEEDGGRLFLKCPDCEYAQHHIPNIVFSHFEANAKNEEEKKE